VGSPRHARGYEGGTDTTWEDWVGLTNSSPKDMTVTDSFSTWSAVLDHLSRHRYVLETPGGRYFQFSDAPLCPRHRIRGTCCGTGYSKHGLGRTSFTVIRILLNDSGISGCRNAVGYSSFFL